MSCSHTVARDASGRCIICLPPRAPVNFTPADLLALERSVVKNSFAQFVRRAWPILEPNGRAYTPNIASSAVIEHCQAVADGDIRKLLVSVPPGSGKSTIITIAWLPWVWLKRPAFRAIHASYAHDLAVTMSRRARRLVESAWYTRISGGIELQKDQNKADDWANTSSGQRISVGTGGQLTGYRADAAICDDSLNAADARSKAIREGVNDWYDEALSTRLDNPDRAPTICVQQRLHSNDLIGHLLEQGGWENLCLPAEYDSARRTVTSLWEDPRIEDGELLCPELHSKKFLAEQKRVLGTAGYSGQYLQNPTDKEGGLFLREWWRFHKPDGTAPDSSKRPRGCNDGAAVALPSAFDRIVISLDAAFKDLSTSDNVCFAVLGVLGAERYLLDRKLGKMSFTRTCEMLVELARKYPGATVLVEDKANGSAILNSLQKVVSNLVAINPQGGKEARAAAVSPAVEGGQVFLPEGAPWLGEWIEEFAAFPRGRHDDQVDAVTQALNYLHEPPDSEFEDARANYIQFWLANRFWEAPPRAVLIEALRAHLNDPAASHGYRWRASDELLCSPGAM